MRLEKEISVGWIFFYGEKFPLRACCAKENNGKSAFYTASEKLSKQTEYY